MKKIAMLDRDGVINKDRGYVGFKKDFVWMPGVKKTIKSLKAIGFLVIVVSNQSGVARNYFKYKDVILLHKYIQNELKKFGTKIDAFYFSPYHIDGSIKKYAKKDSTRKPGIGMFLKIKKKFKVDKKNSFMIGDKKTDMIFAKKCGVKGYYFKGKNLLEFIKRKKLI